MEDLIGKIEQEMECITCLDKPKPNAAVLGLCDTGHMTCESCYRNIVETTIVLACPVCRSQTYKLVRGHKMATLLISILTNHSLYKCKHLGCTEQVIGNTLEFHQQTCAFKPIACPKAPLCNFTSPIQYFLDGQHARCLTTAFRSQETKAWNLIWDTTALYSFDSCDINISDRFKPVLLKGESQTYTSHAYVTAKKRGDIAIVYVGWLNNKKHVEEKYQNVEFSLAIYSFTAHGKVGQFVVKKPKFNNEYVILNEDGIFLPKQTLYNWTDWSKQVKCPECHHKKGHPHLHVKIAFAHDQVEF